MGEIGEGGPKVQTSSSKINNEDVTYNMAPTASGKCKSQLQRDYSSLH